MVGLGVGIKGEQSFMGQRRQQTMRCGSVHSHLPGNTGQGASGREDFCNRAQKPGGFRQRCAGSDRSGIVLFLVGGHV